MEIKWHKKVDEKPRYNEKDFFKNVIIVCGERTMGKGMSICHVLDENATIYSPITLEKYKWDDCHFTYWAYCYEFYPYETT